MKKPGFGRVFLCLPNPRAEHHGCVDMMQVRAAGNKKPPEGGFLKFPVNRNYLAAEAAASTAAEAASTAAEAASVAAEAAEAAASVAAADAASVAAEAASTAAEAASVAAEAAASSAFLPQAARAMAAISEASRSDFFMLVSSKECQKTVYVELCALPTVPRDETRVFLG
jgi:hypothetical protein